MKLLLLQISHEKLLGVTIDSELTFENHITELCIKVSKKLKGCVRYIFACLKECFVCLKESTCETRKNIFYFTSKALFVLEIFRSTNVIKCLSMKHETHIIE